MLAYADGPVLSLLRVDPALVAAPLLPDVEDADSPPTPPNADGADSSAMPETEPVVTTIEHAIIMSAPGSEPRREACDTAAQKFADWFDGPTDSVRTSTLLGSMSSVSGRTPYGAATLSNLQRAIEEAADVNAPTDTSRTTRRLIVYFAGSGDTDASGNSVLHLLSNSDGSDITALSVDQAMDGIAGMNVFSEIVCYLDLYELRRRVAPTAFALSLSDAVASPRTHTRAVIRSTTLINNRQSTNFTDALVEGLSGGAAHATGQVWLRTLYDYIRGEVDRSGNKFGRGPRPQQVSFTHTGEDILLAQAGPGAPPAEEEAAEEPVAQVRRSSRRPIEAQKRATFQPNDAPPLKSRSSGTRRALCMGINAYRGHELNGCVNDAGAWAAALRSLGFEVRSMLDRECTREAILQAVRRLVVDAQAGDVLAIQFSGLGYQLRDLDGDESESDNLDEALVPFDFDGGAFILDDDLRSELSVLQPGVGLTCFFDCCYSGTAQRMFGSSGVASKEQRQGHTAATPRFLDTSRGEREVLAQAHAAFRSGLPARRTTFSNTPLTRQSMRWMNFSACRSNEVALERAGAGDFTTHALRVLAARQLDLTNAEFLQAVIKSFGPERVQTPVLDCPPGEEITPLLGGVPTAA